MKKKLLGIILAAVMVCGLAACGSQPSGDAGAGSAAGEAGGTGEAQYTVGVCQLM